MSKHSSGTWTMSDHGEEITLDCGDIYGAAVLPAHSNDDFPHDEQLANARLMIAAPKLLEALTDLRDYCEAMESQAPSPFNRTPLNEIVAAIAETAEP